MLVLVPKATAVSSTMVFSSWKEWDDDDERVGDLTFESGGQQKHIVVQLYVGGRAACAPLLYRHVFGTKKGSHLPKTSYWMTTP